LIVQDIDKYVKLQRLVDDIVQKYVTKEFNIKIYYLICFIKKL